MSISYKLYHVGKGKEIKVYMSSLELLIERLIEHAGGVSQASKALGLDRGTLTRWRKGIRPSEDNIRALLAYLGLPADWINYIDTGK